MEEIKHTFPKQSFTTKIMHVIHAPRIFQAVELNDFVDFVDELQSISEQLKFEIDNVLSSDLRIKITKPEGLTNSIRHEFKDYKSHWTLDDLTLDDFYYIELSQDHTISEWTIGYSHSDMEKLSVKEAQYRAIHSVHSEFQFYSTYFLFLSHIARPNYLWPTNSYQTLQNGELKTFKTFIIDFSFSLELAEKIRWPIIKNIKMLDVWNWATSFDNDSLDLFGKSKVGRALSAFSHIFSSREESSRQSTCLFWVILGLESLYTSGKENLKKQLIEKTQLVLGHQADYKKLVKELYDYRSRFVHGDIAFPNFFCMTDVGDEFDDYYNKSNKNIDLATAILLASLQWLVLNNTHKLDFDVFYKIRQESNPALKRDG